LGIGEWPVNPIAIVGLGAVLPGARSVPEFWSNALEGRASLRLPTAAARFDPARYLSPDPRVPDRTPVCVGGYVTDDWDFDWRQFRVPPADADTFNPLQFIALSAAAEAVAGVRVHPPETT